MAVTPRTLLSLASTRAGTSGLLRQNLHVVRRTGIIWRTRTGQKTDGGLWWRWGQCGGEEAWGPILQKHAPLRLSLLRRRIQDGDLPADGVAEVHGEALVPLFIVSDQIIQTFEEALLRALSYLQSAAGRKHLRTAKPNIKAKEWSLWLSVLLF